MWAEVMNYGINRGWVWDNVWVISAGRYGDWRRILHYLCSNLIYCCQVYLL